VRTRKRHIERSIGGVLTWRESNSANGSIVCIDVFSVSALHFKQGEHTIATTTRDASPIAALRPVLAKVEASNRVCFTKAVERMNLVFAFSVACLAKSSVLYRDKEPSAPPHASKLPLVLKLTHHDSPAHQNENTNSCLCSASEQHRQ
jgi:hypothetical protein